MKYLKKLGSVLLALVMVLALMAPAFAAGAPVISITNPNGHIFTAYQIFKGEKADDSSLKPASIGWGDYVTAAGKTAIVEALKTAFPRNENTSEAGPFDSIDSSNPDAGALAAILAEQFMNKGKYDNDTARKNLGIAIGGTITTNPPSVSQNVTLNGVNAVDVGWVLITEQLNAQDTNPTFMLQQVTNSESITRKTQDTGVTKEVFNPNIGTSGDYSDAAIYPAPSGAIKFKITVALPDDLIENYRSDNPQKHYDITLHDVQAAALTEVTITSIKLLGKSGNDIMTLTENKDYYKYVGDEIIHKNDTTKPNCTFDIVIPEVENLTNVEDSGSIVVEYTAKLNQNAVTGTEGNPNHVELWTDHKVSEDNVKVYALELDVNKVDGDGNPLAGAKFTLYKDEEWDATKGEPKKDSEGNDLPGIPMDSNDKEIIVGEGENAVVWDAGTRFNVKGLEAGTYYLVETPPSDEYTAIKPIKVVIAASTSEKDGPEAGVLTVTVTSDDNKFTEAGGIVSSTIENVKGTLLPETGGIGTTIFYIVGGVLVVGAVVLLITKRRAGADEE